MKKKTPNCVKDAAIGAAIGTAIIIPGISGGTIALISGAYQRIIRAAKSLFSKLFFKNILILLPFLIGAVISVGALVVPFQLAFKYCLFSIVCLFAGFILGSIPGIHDEIKDEKTETKNTIQLVIGAIFAISIGVLSVVLKADSVIKNLFEEVPFYLYFIIFAVGMIGAVGLVVPGFSGSMLMILIGFYEPILGLVNFDNFLRNVSLLFVFGIGLLIGVVLLSKIMDPLLTNHKKSTMHVVIGFVVGSLVSIFLNSGMVDYIKSDAFGLLDWILGPCLFVVGLILSILFTRFKRKYMDEKNA